MGFDFFCFLSILIEVFPRACFKTNWCFCCCVGYQTNLPIVVCSTSVCSNWKKSTHKHSRSTAFCLFVLSYDKTFWNVQCLIENSPLLEICVTKKQQKIQTQKKKIRKQENKKRKHIQIWIDSHLYFTLFAYFSLNSISYNYLCLSSIVFVFV